MAINKVVHGGKTLIDLTSDTVDASHLVKGYTAHNKAGVAITGTVPIQAAKSITPSTNDQTAVSAGTYCSGAITVKAMTKATQATPSITVSSSGLITARSSQDSGYVSGGTTSSTKQMTTKGATTWTPKTTNQAISSGTYLTGIQTIKGDSNLIAANIVSGKSIFGVTGTGYKSLSGTATASDVIKGKTFSVNGNTLVTGTLEITGENQYKWSEVSSKKWSDLVFDEYVIVWIENYCVNKDTGAIYSKSGSSASDFIAIEDRNHLVIKNAMTSNTTYNVWYDANKNYIGSFDNSTGVVTIPNNAKYFRLSKGTNYILDIAII